MCRKLTLLNGRTQISEVFEKYPGRMREKRVCGIIDNILNAVASTEGRLIANTLIRQYRLMAPANGCHNWFKDGIERIRVPYVNPDFRLAPEFYFYPSEELEV